MLISENLYSHIVGNATTPVATQVVTGACTLEAIVVNTTSSSAVYVIDGTSGTASANVAQLKANVAEGTYTYKTLMSTGLRIYLSQASDLTVVYRV